MRKFPILLTTVLLLQGCPSGTKEEPALRYRFQTGKAYRYRVRGRLQINSGFPFGRFSFRITGSFLVVNRSAKADMLELQLKPEQMSLLRKGRRQRIPGFIRRVVFRRSPILLTSPGGTVHLFKRTGDREFMKPDILTKLLFGLIIPAVDTAPVTFPSFTIPWRGTFVPVRPESRVTEKSRPGKILRERSVTISGLSLQPILFHNLFLQAKTVFDRNNGLPEGCRITGSGSGRMQALLSLPFTLSLSFTIEPEALHTLHRGKRYAR